MRTTNTVIHNETNGDARDDEDEEDDTPIETREVEQLATFDEVMVWGHEAKPASDDAYSKGLEEWVSFAEAVSLIVVYVKTDQGLIIDTDAFSTERGRERCRDWQVTMTLL